MRGRQGDVIVAECSALMSKGGLVKAGLAS